MAVVRAPLGNGFTTFDGASGVPLSESGLNRFGIQTNIKTQSDLILCVGKTQLKSALKLDETVSLLHTPVATVDQKLKLVRDSAVTENTVMILLNFEKIHTEEISDANLSLSAEAVGLGGAAFYQRFGDKYVKSIDISCQFYGLLILGNSDTMASASMLSKLNLEVNVPNTPVRIGSIGEANISRTINTFRGHFRLQSSAIGITAGENQSIRRQMMTISEATDTNAAEEAGRNLRELTEALQPTSVSIADLGLYEDISSSHQILGGNRTALDYYRRWTLKKRDITICLGSYVPVGSAEYNNALVGVIEAENVVNRNLTDRLLYFQVPLPHDNPWSQLKDLYERNPFVDLGIPVLPYENPQIDASVATTEPIANTKHKWNAEQFSQDFRCPHWADAERRRNFLENRFHLRYVNFSETASSMSGVEIEYEGKAIPNQTVKSEADVQRLSIFERYGRTDHDASPGTNFWEHDPVVKIDVLFAETVVGNLTHAIGVRYTTRSGARYEVRSNRFTAPWPASPRSSHLVQSEQIVSANEKPTTILVGFSGNFDGSKLYRLQAIFLTSFMILIRSR
jgi:hypothetical protein